MTPDQPKKQPGPPKKHRRSRSLSMPLKQEVIDLTVVDPDKKTDSLRKHDLNDEDTSIEGPSKRAKLERDSEPPMRKDKSMTPKAKRKKLRKEIDHRKAQRTSNHQELKKDVHILQRDLKDTKQRLHDTEQKFKEEIKALKSDLTNSKQAHEVTQEELKDTKHELEDSKLERKDNIDDLERELAKSRQAHDITKQELMDTKQQLKGKEEQLQSSVSELKSVQSICDSKSEELRKQHLIIETGRDEISRLKTLLNDPLDGLGALQISCKAKDDDLEAKDDRIAALQTQLDETKRQFTSLERSMAETKAALKTAKSNHSDCVNELVKREEKLCSVERDRDAAKVAREKAELDADALHRINEEHGHRTQAARNREAKAKETLKSARAENSQLEKRCVDLQTNLEDQKSERNHTVASLKQKLMASRNQSQRYNHKEPDEKIKADFASLEARIRQFVDSCAKPVLTATDQDLGTLWPHWSPRLREFLASPLLCNFVVEAYIWECLVARIFTPGSDIWAGELGRSLNKTLCLASNEVAGSGYKNDLYIDFQYVRSSSSSLIRHLNGDDFRPKYFDSDVEDMVSNLAKVCGFDVTENMKTDVMDIFREAREFEIQLRMLKAVYAFRLCKSGLNGDKLVNLKHGFNFSDEHMIDRSPKPSDKSSEQARSVDFIMCPALYKRGNNGGANYEIETCLIKMAVVCNAEELSLKPRISDSSRSSSKQAQEPPRSGKVRKEDKGNASISTARKSKKRSSTSDIASLNDDETDEQHQTDTVSALDPVLSTPAPKPHDAAHAQPSTKMGLRTRSCESPKTDNTARGGRSSTKSTNNSRTPAGSARGRGGGSSGKRTRGSKNLDPDANFNPALGSGI